MEACFAKCTMLWGTDVLYNSVSLNSSLHYEVEQIVSKNRLNTNLLADIILVAMQRNNSHKGR